MMPIIFMIIVFSSAISNEKLIRITIETSHETIPIIIIAIWSISLNEIMKIKNKKNIDRWIKVTLNVISLIIIAIFICKNSFLFLIIIELTLIPIIIVIFYSSKDKDKWESLIFMLVLNIGGSVPFIFYSSKSLNSSENLYSYQFYSRRTAIICIIIVIIIKTPLLLLHVWLTKVHVSASGNCSIILARTIIKIGSIGIVKFSSQFLNISAYTLISSMGVIRRILLSIIIIRLFDIKTLVATSSVLHIAILTPIILQKKSRGVIARIMIIISHGVISYYLFYILTLVYEISENRTIIFIRSLQSKRKIICIIIITFMILNTGIPPFINFFSETLFIIVIISRKMTITTIIFAVSLVINILFTIQIITNSIFNKTNSILKGESTMIISKSFVFFRITRFLIIWFF